MPTIVLLTSDTDCDGTSYGAHRVSIPSLDLIGDDRAILAYARETGQMGSYDDYADEIMTLDTFLFLYRKNLREQDLIYFLREGYTSHHMTPNWNPWVYDDTIGIPALDTRYDD